MSAEHEHDRWSDDLAAYMLGALQADEATSMELHLETCERCRRQLRWLEPAVQTLPDGVKRLDPPRRVRDSVMSEVRADARRERARERAEGQGIAASLPAWLRRLGQGSFGWKPAAALAVLALALVAVVGYEVGNDGSDGGGEVGSRTVVVGKAPGVVAKVVREPDGGGRVELANVRQIPDHKVLEAWVERDGSIEPVPALFVPNKDGSASTSIENLEGVAKVLVTKEPKGGSKAPTSTPIATVPLPVE